MKGLGNRKSGPFNFPISYNLCYPWAKPTEVLSFKDRMCSGKRAQFFQKFQNLLPGDL